MKLEVCHRTRSAADRLTSHLHDEAQQRLRPGVIPEDLCSLRFEGRTSDFDDANIVRPVVQRDAPQQRGILHSKVSSRNVWHPLCEISDGWVILELHKAAPSICAS